MRKTWEFVCNFYFSNILNETVPIFDAVIEMSDMVCVCVQKYEL